ncbi:proprotein convertase P-domain-containing protein [Nonomuraea longicatena]|uniref:P/Homo B domain-containing protein n=1 Tax=Nonomuraea longicatena TaxID=83682 RepID=A0ABN1NVS8_9ACTN
MKNLAKLLMRRTAIGAAMTLAALTSGLSAPTPAMAGAPTEHVNYLRVRDTNDCLAYNGTAVSVQRCGPANTKWIFDKATSSEYRLQTNDGNFKCLEASSTTIYMRDCDAWRPAMKWFIVSHGNQTWAPISNHVTGKYINTNHAGGVYMTTGQGVELTNWEWVPGDGLEVRHQGLQASMVDRAISPVNHSTMSGRAPYTWSATGLPPGLSINAETGTISGTPTTAGSFTAQVTVTDSGSLPRSGRASYGWTVVPVPAPGCSGTNTTAKAIHDFELVESYIPIKGCAGNASATAAVEVHITHPRIADLEVSLVAASGRTIYLHNRTGGWASDIHKTFTENLSFSPADGVWKLRVKDYTGGSVGQIDSWSVRL